MTDSFMHGLRYALSLIGTTQTAQARALGVSVPTITRWRAGVAVPNEQNMARIANRSGLDQETIREGGPDAFAGTVDSINQADPGFRMTSIPNR